MVLNEQQRTEPRMLRIGKYLGAGKTNADDARASALEIELPFADRSKSRLRATLSNGVEAAIFLPRGTVLRGGDLLEADDGTPIAVRAAPEKLLVVTGDRLTLMRAAYHLGNRHIPVEVGETQLKLEIDPVLAEMLRRLGATVEERLFPFEPEAGAYGGGHRHGHDATFEDDYALAQAAFESRAMEAGGVGHGHYHDHDHDHPHPPGGSPAPGVLRYPPRPTARTRSK